MIQKFVILKNNETNKLIIREFADLEKNKFSLLCEETYDGETIESALKKGKKFLVSILRTVNLFPSGICAEKIADSVIDLYGSENKPSTEFIVNDLDMIEIKKVKPKPVNYGKKESGQINELLKNSDNESSVEQDELKNIHSAINISGDDSLDIEKDS